MLLLGSRRCYQSDHAWLLYSYPQYWLDNKPGNRHRAYRIRWLQEWGLVGGTPVAPMTI